MPRSGDRVVVVTGDVTTDWNLVTIERSQADTPGSQGASAAWNAEDATRAHPQAGGTALLGDLIAAVAKPLGFTVRHVGEAVKEADAGFRHSYAVWSRFPYAGSEGKDSSQVWRVEKFLGLDRRDQSKGLRALMDWNETNESQAASLVILDDGDLGFRDDKRLWPKVLLDRASERRPWVLLKMARPVGTGKLFEHLIRTCPDRLIVVVRINDLRQSEVRISRELSWERTAEDLLWELTFNPHVDALARCAHVVVSIETGGALLLSSTSKDRAVNEPPKAVLYYDPRFIESEWVQQYPGAMIGYTSCLAAGVARQVMLSPGSPRIGPGVQRGLAAMRALHEKGWEGSDPKAPEELAFPSAKIAQILNGRRRTPFANAPVPPSPAGELLQSGSPGGQRVWTILEDRSRGRPENLARDIAVKGIEAALDGVPIGQFGKLTTVDRHEIEGLRSISALIQEYRRQAGTRPLSIAVFGPPGSGKSFGVKQVATSLLHDEVTELSFNLSQLNDPSELYGALHQVRDKCLEGLLPLVFWDEFDTTLGGNKLGWLRHFLVPMQDGTFQQGEITHPIGRAIFVFAGGIYENMGRFRSPRTPQENKDFNAAKGRDFVSRLKGFVDIVGPDPREDNRDADPFFRVRRAILLRSILERDRPHLFSREKPSELQIDSGVLSGILETRRYRHGVRSLEAIVAMSTLAGKSSFERSSLPAEPQLDLHVDAVDFLRRVQGLVVLERPPEASAEDDEPQMPGERNLFERLAEGVHVVYCERLLDDDYVWGEPTDEYLERQRLLKRFAGKTMDDRRAAADAKTKSALIPYENLPSDLKEQNRAFARDIPNKLDHLSYIMRPSRPGDSLFEFSNEAIEALAEQEHDRWTREKLKTQYRWGPEDNDRRKENASLLPWRTLSQDEKKAHYGDYAEAIGDEELSDDVKEWDRWLVAGIPKILAVGGYTAVKHVEETSPEDDTVAAE